MLIAASSDGSTPKRRCGLDVPGVELRRRRGRADVDPDPRLSAGSERTAPGARSRRRAPLRRAAQAAVPGSRPRTIGSAPASGTAAARTARRASRPGRPRSARGEPVVDRGAERRVRRDERARRGGGRRGKPGPGRRRRGQTSMEPAEQGERGQGDGGERVHARQGARPRSGRPISYTASMGWPELVFMLVVLKLPVVYLCCVVWWAIKAEPRPEEGAATRVALDPEPPCPGGAAAPHSAARPAAARSAAPRAARSAAPAPPPHERRPRK